MESKTKRYEKLEIPEDSIWDRKKYDPILWLYSKKAGFWPEWAENAFDFWFVPKRIIGDFFNFLKRLYIWIPVLWKDRDWDDFYILEILKTKLITHRKFLIENNRHTCVPDINRDITICLNLIERFQNSYYEMEYFNYFDNYLWFDDVELDSSLEDKPNPSRLLKELKSKTTRDNLLEYIDKYPIDRKKTILWIKNKNMNSVDDYKENAESRHSLAVFMAAYRHKKCKKLLFQILTEKVEYWWD